MTRRRGLASDRGATALGVALIAFLSWSVVYPNAGIIAGSFARGLADWREFAGSPTERAAFQATVVVAVASVLASLLLGLPLAFLVTRVEFRGRRLLAAVATLPAALPPLIGVLAYDNLYGETGFVTRLVSASLHLSALPWRLSGLPAVVFVHAGTMYVYVFLFVAAALERYDTSLDEAAQGLGASRWLHLRRVVLPLLTPALAGAMILVFMNSLGSFSAPFYYSGGTQVLTLRIYKNWTENGNFALANVETSVLALTAIAALALLRWIEGRRQYTLAGKGRATRRPLQSPVARRVLPLLAACLVLFLVLPHAMVIALSFTTEGTWLTQLLPTSLTLDNFRTIAARRQNWMPIVNSLEMTAAATAANALFGFAVAYVVVLSRAPGRRLLSALAVLPWAIPGTAIAVSLLAMFNRNDPLLLRIQLASTVWLLPLAYFIRNIPLVSGAVEGSLRQMDQSTDDAARGLGASRLLTLRRVILPAARPGLIAGSILAAVAAVGEFAASALLKVPSNRPISMAIAEEVRAFSFSHAAAYGVVLIVLVLAIAAGGRWMGTEGWAWKTDG